MQLWKALVECCITNHSAFQKLSLAASYGILTVHARLVNMPSWIFSSIFIPHRAGWGLEMKKKQLNEQTQLKVGVL